MVQLRSDDAIILINPRKHGWKDRLEFCLRDLTTDEAVRALVSSDRWASYVLGVFHVAPTVSESIITGATTYIESDVPPNKGVNSSAAVESPS